MMPEFQYLFCIGLQKKLREKIIGNIYVKVNPNDDLIVDIRLDYENIDYRWKRIDISNAILRGYNSDDAVWEIYKSYKAYIRHRFFKESSI